MAMEVIYSSGTDDLAKVYVARFRGSDRYILEFVDSVSGASSRADKWVLIVSSQFGCPVGCRFCDAAGYYEGNATLSELMDQVDFIVRVWEGRYVEKGVIITKKFKVQFARMGEPALNDAVLEAIYAIKDQYKARGYMPCISTIAPKGREGWFEELIDMNHSTFRGKFQLQFSVHSTNESVRDRLVPLRKWTLEDIAEYGRAFYYKGGRKVTLNFALSPHYHVSAEAISSIFDPRYFAVKLTPVNPTTNAYRNGLVNVFDYPDERTRALIMSLEKMGFTVILSIGEMRENEIGSNCGQLVGLWKKAHAFRSKVAYDLKDRVALS